MSFDYFYGQQSDLFTFYRVPKVLFTNERFWNISADAKMLYGILLDRMSLSAKNGWIDKNGRVYIIFTIDEAKMALNCAEQKAIKNYRNTRQIYIEYRKSGYSKKFFEEHRQEITIHKAAKQAFDELQITKLPSMQSLYEEFHQLAVQKKQGYAEYRQIRKEKEELLIAKRTVETILNIDRQKEQEKEQEKEEKKNFR